MIVDRSVIHAQFGTGGKMAAALGAAMGPMLKELGETRKWRVMSDRSGTFDTVVLEIEANSIAEHEALRARIFQSQTFRDSMAKLQGTQVGGHREYYAVEAEG